MSDFHLFERFGVELEYMIVDRSTLEVRPISDELLRAATGAYQSDADMGALSWSNELVLHVIELKTNGPAQTLDGLAEPFQSDVRRINELLATQNAMLMPTAMHPWMDPDTQTRLWPHEYNAVYEAFNRIFNCRGHGWSNLQSVHLNLPFVGDDEFGRLHAAIRVLLPILPALAASSPIADGRDTGFADFRMESYRRNSQRIPSVAGDIIPEPVFTRAAYEREILQRIYRDIAPHDPEGVLQDEFLNARGAIARFCRNTFEIRVLDIQECPAADLAIVAIVVAALRALCNEQWSSRAMQESWEVAPLQRILFRAIRDGDSAVIENPRYLRTLGYEGAVPVAAGTLWNDVFERVERCDPGSLAPHVTALGVILSQGTLSQRIRAALCNETSRRAIERVYRRLSECVAEGRMFV